MPYVARKGSNLESSHIKVKDDGELDLGSSLADYHFMGFDDSTTTDTVYIFKERKGGAWFVRRVNTSTGVVDYAVGSSNLAAAVADPAGQSYDDFSVQF